MGERKGPYVNGWSVGKNKISIGGIDLRRGAKRARRELYTSNFTFGYPN